MFQMYALLFSWHMILIMKKSWQNFQEVNGDIIWLALLYKNRMEENMYFTNKMCIILCTLWYITLLKEFWCQIPLDVVWYFLTSNISGIPILILFFNKKKLSISSGSFLPAPWVMLYFLYHSAWQRRSSN